METPIHSHWFMGYPQWFELALFGLLAVISLILLTKCRPRHDSASAPIITAPPKTPQRNRSWYLSNILVNGFLFTLLGLGYTIYSEMTNVNIKGNWGYTELMPIIPVIEIGGMPFIQWVLIPPVLLWLMRMFVQR